MCLVAPQKAWKMRLMVTMWRMVMLRLQRREIMREREELLHQLIPQEHFLPKPDVLLKAGQLFPPQIIIYSCTRIFTNFIVKGFFIKLILKVLQNQIKFLDFLHGETVLLIKNSNVFC